MVAKRLKTREFLAEAAELVRMQLPEELRDLQVVGPAGALIKLHYGDPSVHYEVWVRRRAGTIEVGLHFEGSADANSRYLAGMTGPYAPVLAALGPGVEPEEWAGSWTRVHQVFPLSVLDEDTLMVVSGCLAQMVRRLEPVVRELSSS
jgi:hypothetical protein